MSTSPETDFDLEKLFLPAWAQESASVNRYAKYAGDDRPVNRDSKFDDRRPGGRRPPRRDGGGPGARQGGGGPPRRDQPGGPRREGDRGPRPGFGGPQRGGPRRDGGRGGERGGDRRDRPERREAPLPLPDLDV